MLMLLPAAGSYGRYRRRVQIVSPVVSRQLFQQGGQVGERIQDMVGGAGSGLVRAREVLAGLDQHPGEPLALGGEHIGFDVVNLEAFVASLEAKGIKIDSPVRQVPNSSVKIAFLTDPYGTYIELTEGLEPK